MLPLESMLSGLSIPTLLAQAHASLPTPEWLAWLSAPRDAPILVLLALVLLGLGLGLAARRT
jgi:phosphotransferase system  glucose/maltose/N-acetylglucosamine-specific IIC component